MIKNVSPKAVIGILIADDDEDGYEADPVKAGNAVKALFELIEDEDTSADEVAEFIYTWRRL